MKRMTTITAAALLVSVVAASAGQAVPTAAAQAPAAPQAPAGVTPPPDYVIGEGDVLTITYWRDKDMTGDYIVRPDGKVTLPLLGDVDAKGLAPEQFKDRLLQVSTKLLVEPTITVGVKAINSRKVYITGGVAKPAPYDLLTPMTVLQLISVAGSLREFVDGKNIRIIRVEGGKTTQFKFNYKEMLEGKNPNQNIFLKPGDTVLVPE